MNRFNRSTIVSLRKSMLLIACACLMSMNLDAQSKSQKNDAAGTVVEQAGRSVILPMSTVKHLNDIFNFSTDASLTLVMRNAGAIEIFGIQYAEKVTRLASDFLSTRPLSNEDYLRYVLPGPIITGDLKNDSRHYELALRLFFELHPEARAFAPAELAAMLTTSDGVSKLMEMQVAAGMSMELAQPAAKPGPAQPAKFD